MPSRVLYVGQQVQIVSVAGGTRYLPVQSASCEVTRPLEDLQSFGHLGSLGRFQNAVSTCKADIKSYIANVTGIAGSTQNLVNTQFLTGLTGEALAGTNSVITVSPNGFTMSGILSSFGCEITQGGFATADFSFVGVGEPVFAASPTNSSFTEQSNMPTSFTPVVSTNVSGQITGGCANSFKFNLDLPNESISCLGGSVTGSQVAVANSFLQVAKPPFKTSISVEGLAVDPPSVPSAAFILGKLSISLPNAQVTNRSFNNAVGAAGATYNYSLDDISVNFSDISP